MMKIAKHINDIQPYVPGKPIEEVERELGIKAIKLASNENPLGPSPKALEAASAALASIHRYPDGGAYNLRNALAVKHGLGQSELIFGNGSNELIELAARAFIMPGDEALMAAPSFPVYESVVKAIGAAAVVVPLRDFRHDLHAMAARITGKTRIVFIANPNNPTGTIVTMAEFAAFMRRVPDNCLVVMDEAYNEYVSDPECADSMQYLCGGRDVLVLRTFSKAYGLAGLRIGYGMGPETVIEAMNRIRQPFNTSSPAQAAALAALGDRPHLDRVIETNNEGRKYLCAALSGMGQPFVVSQTNFIYMPLDGPLASGDVYYRLMEKGVIVRPAGPQAIRVTIGLPEENRRFIEAFTEVIGRV
ncbi:MAG: histidinol-phosphate transaminase [Nitrospirae bacterium]|nr:histidinol-phosphate transaminase [Nitrospirota bacterium]